MSFARAWAFAASLAMAAAPCAAAGLDRPEAPAERRSGAGAGLYFAVPFGGEHGGRARAGLRMGLNHEYRDFTGRQVRASGVNTLDLRLIGEPEPTLFVADMPVTGRQDSRRNLMGGGPFGIVLIGLALVGAYVIYEQLDDDDENVPNQ